MTDEGGEAGASGDATVEPAASEPKRAPLPNWWWRQSLQTRRVIAVGVLFVLAVALVGVVAQLLQSDDGGDGPYADAYAWVDSQAPETIAVWDALAECETNSEWTRNTGNGFFGGLQFQMSSWLEVDGAGQPDQAPREEQIYRGDQLRQIQGWTAWPSCAAQLGLQ